MSPQLPFDTLYSIFSFLPSPGMLYREDRRLYDAVEELGLPVPLTNTKDLASCASVCRTWRAPAQRFLLRDIRVVNHTQCAFLINVTSDPEVGRDVHSLEFINGTRRPDLRSLRADITPQDVVSLVKNCPRLKSLTLYGCPLYDEGLGDLVRDASLDEMVILGLSRQAYPLTLKTVKLMLDRMPRLRALACPALSCESHFLPSSPMNKLSVLVTHQDSLYSYWLSYASVDTLVTFDPEFHSHEAMVGVKRALARTGSSLRRLRIPAAVFVSDMLPLCPNLRHLAFPVLEMEFEPLLASISAPLESLTLFSDQYIGRKAKATLSASYVRILINAIETDPNLDGLNSLDLSLTYDEDAYPFTPAEEFTLLKTVCLQRGIRFPCPDVPRLINGPRGANPRLYGDIQDFEDTWA